MNIPFTCVTSVRHSRHIIALRKKNFIDALWSRLVLFRTSLLSCSQKLGANVQYVSQSLILTAMSLCPLWFNLLGKFRMSTTDIIIKYVLTY